MEYDYPLTLGDETVGLVHLREDGLYWKLSCTCRLPLGEIYDVLACWGRSSRPIGVPVPIQGTFRLEKHIPLKKLSRENLSFAVRSRRAPREMAVPICEELPFLYLCSLKTAHLEKRQGQHYLVFPIL